MQKDKEYKTLRGFDKIKFANDWNLIVEQLKKSNIDLSRILIAPLIG